MKHEYIKTNVHDCRKKLRYEQVKDEIVNKYHITNIYDDGDDEALLDICDTLYEDYLYRNTDYHAYIEDGMNIRILMELRKSALFPFTDKKKADEFFQSFSECETVEDIKRVRIAYIQNITKDYVEAGWQYYYLMKVMLTDKGFEDFSFNYEQYFADRDLSKWEPVEAYDAQMFNAHTPESLHLEVPRGCMI